MSSLPNVLTWIGPACILTGSLLAAANAGARWTGYGFIFLTLGAASFGIASVANGDVFGSVVNGALVIVNGIGVRRWLGHLAVAEAAASQAESTSKQTKAVPTISPLSQIIGRNVVDMCGDKLGVLADIMIELPHGTPSYYVIHPSTSSPGTGFLGVHPDSAEIGEDDIVLRCDIDKCVELDDQIWPSKLPAFT